VCAIHRFETVMIMVQNTAMCPMMILSAIFQKSHNFSKLIRYVKYQKYKVISIQANATKPLPNYLKFKTDSVHIN